MSDATRIASYSTPPNTEEFILEKIFNGTYERHQLDLVKRYVKPHHRVLEGGAGLGVVTREIAKRAQFVVSCEANPSLAYHAKRNAPDAWVIWAQLTKNVHTGEAFGVQDAPHIAVHPPDNLVSGYDLNALVLDIEGAEVEVLNEIDLDPIELIIAELHPTRCRPDALQLALIRLWGAGFDEKARIDDGDLNHCVWQKDAS